MSARLAFAFALGVALAPGWCMGQNLVPNGSFEEYTECPDAGGQIQRATGWYYTQGSPEYFNRCSTQPYPSVPFNKIGYQEPLSGDAYAGVITYSDSNWFQPPELLREHIGRYLTEPLIPGVPVHISFWVSPGGFGSTIGTRVRWTSNGIGVKFRIGSCEPQWAAYADNSDAVHLQNPLLDTLGWTFVTGTYVPDSAYDCIVIGNFVSDSFLNPVLLDPNGVYGVAYAFVDDVCVSFDGATCLAQSGMVHRVHGVLGLSPNPSTGVVRLDFSGHGKRVFRIRAHTALGREVLSLQVRENDREMVLDISGWPPGLYWFVSESPANTLYYGPLVLNP